MDQNRQLYETLMGNPVSNRTWYRVKARILYSNPCVNSETIKRYFDFKNSGFSLPKYSKEIQFFLFSKWVKNGEFIIKSNAEIIDDLKQFENEETLRILLGTDENFIFTDAYPLYAQVITSYRKSLDN